MQFVVLPVGTNTDLQTIQLPSQYRAMKLTSFPGNDASYPANQRTKVFYWVVLDAYGGSYGGY